MSGIVKEVGDKLGHENKGMILSLDYFEMPPGDGSYRLTISHIDIGEYPAGKTVSVGSLFESRAIRVSGTNLPPAYVYVPTSSSDIH